MMTPLQSSTNGKQRDEKNRESDHGILVDKNQKERRKDNERKREKNEREGTEKGG